MNLAYDPGDGESFWQAISLLPGYPPNVRMPIREMVFESDALFKLPLILESIGALKAWPVLIVMDPTPMRRAGVSLKPLICEVLKDAGWQPQTLQMEPDQTGQVHTDMTHIETVKAQIRPQVAVIALGSGTICDIAKHACYLYEKESGHQIPFVVYQTANSVSAYTSCMAPTFVEGVKRTLPSRYPDALICDLETLRDAPNAMTAGGVGDLLAAFVSLPDWYLAKELKQDMSFTSLAEALMGPLDDILLEEGPHIHNGSLEGTAILAKLIALGGIVMSLSNTSAPMSGYEHIMSHYLDLLNEVAQLPLAMHGSQCALAAVLCAGAYQHFLAEFEPSEINIESCFPSAQAMEETIRRTLLEIDPSGKAGEECWSDYRIKLQKWHQQRPEFERLLAEWNRIRGKVSQGTRPANRLLEILKTVEAPLTFEQIDPPVSQAQVRAAFMNAPYIRNRLTLGDLLIFLNWDREKLWDEIWKEAKF